MSVHGGARRGRAWTPAERQRVLKLVEEGVSYREISRQYSVSHNTISGIAFRQRHGVKYKADLPPAERRKYEAQHVIRQLEPSDRPFATDSSCPKFVNHDEHLAAVLQARTGGYPVLAVRL